jgi:hypothetical protein
VVQFRNGEVWQVELLKTPPGDAAKPERNAAKSARTW